MPDHIFIYGPPGSGKSTLGQALGRRLEMPFVDLDSLIESDAGCPVREIFATEGEVVFREREAHALGRVCLASASVVALGGGALLDAHSRALAEGAGKVICLSAPADVLAARTAAQPHSRPLLAAGDGAVAQSSRQLLAALLERRAPHYASFALQLDAAPDDLDRKVEAAQILCGAFRIADPRAPYDARVGTDTMGRLGAVAAARDWRGAAVVVADSHTASPYGDAAVASLRAAGLTAQLVTIPAGEVHKRIETVSELWRGLMRAGLDRGGTVVAVGGGVVGDLAGFAAATWLRGVRWVGVPTTLLAMVDSSLGGKTGFDLPEGKNLVGAFHVPSLVLADTRTLRTLPPAELRCGLAETVKHGLAGDPYLFGQLERLAAGNGTETLTIPDTLVARAMAFKIRIVESDPHERGVRAILNLGHTVGHALESASRFTLRHGEAVAIGLVAEARIAERMGLAETGLVARLSGLLRGFGLPVVPPSGLDREAFMSALRLDKKRRDGVVRFALPLRIGEARHGIEVDERLLHELFTSQKPEGMRTTA
ncbi:MAG: 3-dehydroquinate synthase [Kiritimatiellae bacterium]|nr:3-dehydroquinate synthase [Kiritimatiellia bacterium]